MRALGAHGRLAHSLYPRNAARLMPFPPVRQHGYRAGPT